MRRSRASAAPDRRRSRRPVGIAARRGKRRGRDNDGRSRSHARPAPDEGRGGAPDRAGRYRRCLAGDARDARVDRCRGHRSRRRGPLSPGRRGPTQDRSRRAIPRIPNRDRATSCSPWARWVPTSSTIRATSTSSSFSIPRPARSKANAEPGQFYVRLTRGLVKLSAGSAPPTATYSASICGCDPIRRPPRSPFRPRPRSTITRAAARTGSAPR